MRICVMGDLRLLGEFNTTMTKPEQVLFSLVIGIQRIGCVGLRLREGAR